MRKLLLALAVFATTAAAWGQGQGPMAAVNQFVDALNKGDLRAAAAACARPASVVDDFPPHEWQGSTACADWGAAFAAYNEQNGITNGVVRLGKPWHVDVTGDRAYVVVPASFAYRQHGKEVDESGSVFTLALRKMGAAWRIAGWSWADR